MTRRIAEMVARDLQSINIVERSGFQASIKLQEARVSHSFTYTT